jgi:hypothetical protein
VQFKSTITALFALPIVAACNLNGSNVVTKSELIQASQNYAPVYADGVTSIYESLTTTGLTGFAGNPDGTVSEIRVRVDLEAGLAYISIDGAEEIEYDDVQNQYNALIFYNQAAQHAYVSYYGYEPNYISFGGGEIDADSSGYFGQETASAALPTETAIYSGYWDAEGATASTNIYANGNMGLAVGFATGNVTGYSNGSFNASNNETETYDGGSFIGTITGTVTGSRIAGTMTVDGDATGEMDLMGAIYGDDAGYAAGGIGGSLTSEAGTQSLGGNFYLYRSHGCGLC